MFGWFRRRRRKITLASVWPEPWSLHLNRNVRLSWGLTDHEVSKLRNRVQVFVAEKRWEGYEGLEVTEEMKVTVAGQACLMLLGVQDFYFDNVKTILLYPRAFARKTSDGISTNQVQHRAGEAWQGGPIVLAWKSVLQGGRNEDDGQNVVIHEFAHALDGLDGEMGGSVMFDDPETSQRWRQVVEAGFAELSKGKKNGHRTLLDHYGATNQAEFFAVATETFFEKPQELQDEHAELFWLLQKYFKIDPTPWQRPQR